MDPVRRIAIPTPPALNVRMGTSELLVSLGQYMANVSMAVNELAGEVAELKGYLIGKDAEIQTLKKTSTDLWKHVQGLRRKLRQVTGEVEETQEEVDSIREDSKITQINELRKQLAERDKKLERIQHSSDEAVKWWQRRIVGRVVDIVVTAAVVAILYTIGLRVFNASQPHTSPESSEHGGR